MKRHTTTNLLIALLLATLVSGCGWQLRGKGMIPEGLDTLHVVSRDPNGKLAMDLARALESAGVDVPASGADADLSLVIVQERSLTRVASVNENARVSEQELTEEAEFTIVNRSGDILLPRSLVSVTRIFE